MPSIERAAFPLELKLSGDGKSGVIEGYASTFGNVDSYGDVILPGAFNASLAVRKSRGYGNPPMYMQHGPFVGGDPRPVGVWTSMDEDSRGLRVIGQLSGLETETGRYHHALVSDGAMRGLSIGYTVPKGGAKYGEKEGEPKRTLRAINLHEVSIVDDPANTLARIESLRRAGAEVNDPRAFEGFLRDAGYSRAFAKAIVANGFKAAIGLRDADDPAASSELAQEIRASAAQLQALLNGTGP